MAEVDFRLYQDGTVHSEETFEGEESPHTHGTFEVVSIPEELLGFIERTMCKGAGTPNSCLGCQWEDLPRSLDDQMDYMDRMDKVHPCDCCARISPYGDKYEAKGEVKHFCSRF